MLGLILFVVGAWLGYLAFAHVQDRVDYLAPRARPRRCYERLRPAGAGAGSRWRPAAWSAPGLGQGSPTLIPYVGTDFIFAAFGEELGHVRRRRAAAALPGAGRARAARRRWSATDGFGKLLAIGLTTVIALQTFVIVGGVTRLIPLTGVPLPFVSYGGSSLVANFVMLALLVRVSRRGPGSRRGRRPPMDRQIRRLGIGVRRVVRRCCSRRSTYVQVFAADRIAEQPRERPARSSRSTRSSAARSSPRDGSGDPARRASGAERRAPVPARTTRRGRCTPASPATTRASTAAAGWSRRCNDYLSGARRSSPPRTSST